MMDADSAGPRHLPPNTDLVELDDFISDTNTTTPQAKPRPSPSSSSCSSSQADRVPLKARYEYIQNAVLLLPEKPTLLERVRSRISDVLFVLVSFVRSLARSFLFGWLVTFPTSVDVSAATATMSSADDQCDGTQEVLQSLTSLCAVALLTASEYSISPGDNGPAWFGSVWIALASFWCFYVAFHIVIQPDLYAELAFLREPSRGGSRISDSMAGSCVWCGAGWILGYISSIGRPSSMLARS